MADQIEGKNPVLEALRSGRAINKIMLSRDLERHSAIAEILHLSKANKVLIDWVPSDIIRKKSQTGAAQGVIAYASAKNYVELDDLLERQTVQPAFYLILDGLEDPHNLGAIIRTADAVGVHGIIIPQRRAVPLTETVAKVSAGAIEYVPVARVNNLNNAIRAMKEKDIRVIGIDQGEEKKLAQADFRSPVAIVIGGEGKGISRLVKENCDEVVGIPMKGRISSLNASVAAAVVMFEVARQRG